MFQGIQRFLYPNTKRLGYWGNSQDEYYHTRRSPQQTTQEHRTTTQHSARTNNRHRNGSRCQRHRTTDSEYGQQSTGERAKRPQQQVVTSLPPPSRTVASTGLYTFNRFRDCWCSHSALTTTDKLYT